MRIAIFFFLLSLTSCSVTTPEYTEEDDKCTQLGYNVVSSNFEEYAEWRENYMEYISTCLEDTTVAILLAQRDADLGDYTFIIYGLVVSIEPFQEIFQKYPIGFHSPGCESTPAGQAYNKELKKLLLENEGIDYDKVMDETFDEFIIE